MTLAEQWSFISTTTKTELQALPQPVQQNMIIKGRFVAFSQDIQGPRIHTGKKEWGPAPSIILIHNLTRSDPSKLQCQILVQYQYKVCDQQRNYASTVKSQKIRRTHVTISKIIMA